MIKLDLKQSNVDSQYNINRALDILDYVKNILFLNS